MQIESSPQRRPESGSTSDRGGGSFAGSTRPVSSVASVGSDREGVESTAAGGAATGPESSPERAVGEPSDAAGAGAAPPTERADGDGARDVARSSIAGWLLRAILLIGLILVAYYLVTLWQVWSTGRSEEARPVDAIVVLGAAQYDGRPSPQLAARLDHAVELWPDGIAPVVVVTGGNQPGDRFTEAEASASYLVDRGVPESAILLENTGSTTYESLDMVAGTIVASDATVLIVTDPYHALRSRLIAEELGLTAFVSPTGTSVVTGGESFGRHVKEAAGIAAGRIIGFGRLDDLTD